MLVYGSGNDSQEGSMPQISLPYSAMVRSELNLPEAATFKMAILAHKAWSWKLKKKIHSFIKFFSFFAWLD